jgi:DNA replication protein DnaC
MSLEITATIEAERTEATCLECGAKFTPRRMLLFDRVIIPSLCEPCADKRDANMVTWLTICPYEFRTTKEGGNTRLEKMDAACPSWRGILDWKFSPKGLLVRGVSGRCKTRAMWRLLRRLFDERRKIIALSSAQFDRQCRDAGGNFTLSAWFDRLATADVLFIDDLGKGSWTQNTEAQFFDLIDQRTREGRPILATTNDSGDSLAARLSEDRGEPLIRRLRDYCTSYVF